MYTPAMAVADALYNLHNGVVVPDYEQLLEKTYRGILRPGDIAVDVGANMGRHTLPLAEAVCGNGQVIAFEPIPLLADELRNRTSDQPHVEIRNVALSSEAGDRPFVHHTNASGRSGLKRRDFEFEWAETEDILVTVETLDAQLGALPSIRFMKIDVEGGEIDVLKGGEEVISRHRPTIAVEYGSPSYEPYGNTKMTLWDWCHFNGYQPSDLFGNVIRSPQEWQAVCDRSYWDYLLIPAD